LSAIGAVSALLTERESKRERDLPTVAQRKRERERERERDAAAEGEKVAGPPGPAGSRRSRSLPALSAVHPRHQSAMLEALFNDADCATRVRTGLQ